MSPTAALRFAVAGFGGSGKAQEKSFPPVAVLKAATKIKARLRATREEKRYFDGEFRGPAPSKNKKMWIIKQHKMHDDLIDKASSKVRADIARHTERMKVNRAFFTNNTYKEDVRESQQRVIDQDNNLLLGQLYKIADRKNLYDDSDFVNLYKRRKQARNFARSIDVYERAKHLDFENQNMLRRLTGITACYDAKKWEADFARTRRFVEHSAQVKKPKWGAQKVKHKKKFRASASAVEMRKQLIPAYDARKDKYCKAFHNSPAQRKIMAKQRRLEAREAARKKRLLEAKTPKWRKKH